MDILRIGLTILAIFISGAIVEAGERRRGWSVWQCIGTAAILGFLIGLGSIVLEAME